MGNKVERYIGEEIQILPMVGNHGSFVGTVAGGLVVLLTPEVSCGTLTKTDHVFMVLEEDFFTGDTFKVKITGVAKSGKALFGQLVNPSAFKQWADDITFHKRKVDEEKAQEAKAKAAREAAWAEKCKRAEVARGAEERKIVEYIHNLPDVDADERLVTASIQESRFGFSMSDPYYVALDVPDQEMETVRFVPNVSRDIEPILKKKLHRIIYWWNGEWSDNPDEDSDYGDNFGGLSMSELRDEFKNDPDEQSEVLYIKDEHYNKVAETITTMKEGGG